MGGREDGGAAVAVSSLRARAVDTLLANSPAGGAAGAQDLQLPGHGAGPVQQSLRGEYTRRLCSCLSVLSPFLVLCHCFTFVFSPFAYLFL